jgi:hypothetical protein
MNFGRLKVADRYSGNPQINPDIRPSLGTLLLAGLTDCEENRNKSGHDDSNPRDRAPGLNLIGPCRRDNLFDNHPGNEYQVNYAVDYGGRLRKSKV